MSLAFDACSVATNANAKHCVCPILKLPNVISCFSLRKKRKKSCVPPVLTCSPVHAGGTRAIGDQHPFRGILSSEEDGEKILEAVQGNHACVLVRISVVRGARIVQRQLSGMAGKELRGRCEYSCFHA